MISGPPQDETQGGMGGVVPLGVKRDRPATRDVRLIERLVRRSDWNISDVAYDRLPNEILLIALDKTANGSPAGYPLRERLSAARTLAHMNSQNQANHPLAQQHDHRHAHLHGHMELPELIAFLQREVERE